MAIVPTSYKNADAFGTPAFEVLDEYTNTALLASGSPALTSSKRILLGDTLTLAQFSVVGISAGKLVLATDGLIAAVGVLAHAAASGAANATKWGEVLITGDFNIGPDSPLVWDVSFTTEAKKAAVGGQSANLMFRRRTASGSAGA